MRKPVRFYGAFSQLWSIQTWQFVFSMATAAGSLTMIGRLKEARTTAAFGNTYLPSDVAEGQATRLVLTSLKL